MTDQFVWTGPASGSWAVPANWTDTTTSQHPAGPPDSTDDVTINALGGNATQTITGTGSSHGLTITGNASLAGTFSTGLLTLPDSGFVNLYIQSGASLSDSGGATLGSEGDITVLGGSLTVTGTVGGGRVGSQSSGRVQVGGLNNVGASVDSTSTFEVGTAGGAQAGVFTVDAGATATSLGVGSLAVSNAGTINGGLIYTNQVNNTGTIYGVQFHAYGDSVDMSFNNSGTMTLTGDWLPGALVDNGVLVAAASTTGLNNMVSTVTGTGQIQIAAGGDLTTGAVGSGITVSFLGSTGSLDISSNSLDTAKTYDAQISGFQAGDVIDFGGKVTQATYNAGNGLLTLANGSTVVAKLHLVGDYSSATFTTTALTSGATLITLGGGGDTNTPPAGTTNSDQYLWSGSTPGSWDVAGNWTDTTTSSSPAAVAPGIHDSVTINSGTTSLPQVITGTGNSAQLTIGGNTTLAGHFSTGGLSVSSNDSLTVQSSASLAVGGDATSSGYLTAAGGALSISGTLTGAVTASGGGTVQLGALTGGAGVDATSSIEVGTAGGAQAGAFTVDAGATATLGSLAARTVINHGTMTNTGGHLVVYTGTVINTGTMTGVDFHALNDNVNLSFNNSGTITLTGDWLPGSVVNNGVIIAAPSTTGLNSMVGPVTGTGQLQIAAGGDLSTTTVAASETVAFTASSGSLDISSGSLNGAKFYDPHITGFQTGDVINFGGKVTKATYNATNGVLALANGSTVVAKLHLDGSYAGAAFTTTALGGSTLISVSGGGDTSTPPAGTTTPDQYLWSGPTPGSWDLAANWTDTTTSSHPAALAPGIHDTVTINSGTNQLPQVVTGTGNSAQLNIGGNTALAGKFSTGGLSVSSGDSLAVQSNGALTVNGAATASGALTAAGGSIKVSGTLSGGLSASNGGKVQIGALNGGASLDSTSSIEVGTAGGAKAGAFMVDSGATATLSGLTARTIVNQGTMTSSGSHVVAYTATVTNAGTIYGVDFHALNDSVNLTFNNSGTITLTGDWLPGAVTNSGVIIAAASTTGLNSMVGDVTGKGQLQIANGGDLVTGHVAAGETVVFTGSSGSLDISSNSLDGAKTYDPKISGFQVGDVINYGGNITSAVYKASNGMLSLLHGTQVVAKLHLVGNYSGDTFQTSPNGGSTQISISAAPHLAPAEHSAFAFPEQQSSPPPSLVADVAPSGDAGHGAGYSVTEDVGHMGGAALPPMETLPTGSVLPAWEHHAPTGDFIL